MSIRFHRCSILAIALIAGEPALAIEPSPDPDHSRTLDPRGGDRRYYTPVPPFDSLRRAFRLDSAPLQDPPPPPPPTDDGQDSHVVGDEDEFLIQGLGRDQHIIRGDGTDAATVLLR